MHEPRAWHVKSGTAWGAKMAAMHFALDPCALHTQRLAARAAGHYTALRHVALCCTTPFRSTPHRTAPHQSAPRCITRHLELGVWQQGLRRAEDGGRAALTNLACVHAYVHAYVRAHVRAEHGNGAALFNLLGKPPALGTNLLGFTQWQWS